MRKPLFLGAMVGVLMLLGGALALGSSLGRASDAEPSASVAPPVRGWGDTHIPYRTGSGHFCEVAAEGTSIRPDVVNRLVFLSADDARLLIAELRARDLELVAAAPIELKADLDAIARAADRLFAGLEANESKLKNVPEHDLSSLSAHDLHPAFERATAYLRTQCDIDIWGVLSTV
jgi:hypothetical protein